MSHFTCLVIVRDATYAPEAQAKAEQMLAPYDEGIKVPHEEWGNTPTALLDEALDWRTAEHVTPEQKAEYEAELVKDHGAEPEDRMSPEWIAWGKKVISEYHGGKALWDLEKGFGRVSTYNPLSKWDWYSLGGRWTGYWPIKPGAEDAMGRLGRPGLMTDKAPPLTADLAQKGDIDFDMRRREAELSAEERYSLFEKYTSRLSEQDWTNYQPWSYFEEKVKIGLITIEDARVRYHEQSPVQALQSTEAFHAFGFCSPEDFFHGNGGRERYVRDAANNAFSTFAVLTEDGWFERGDMGWWGMVSDEKDQNEWNAQWAALVSSLDDSAWLAVYDLHI